MEFTKLGVMVLFLFCCCVIHGKADRQLSSSRNRNTRHHRRSSRFSEMGITTPAALYSDGESALGRASIVPALNITAPPNTLLVLLRRVCPTSWEDSFYDNGGHRDTHLNCRPQPELWRVCFENNPCGPNSECEIVNATRTCSCMSSFKGSPPECVPGAEHDSCENNPCGSHSVCDPFAEERCHCLPGFTGEPPYCTAGPALLARCNPYPCGGHSNCDKKNGNPVCECLPGYIGNPPNCKPDHVTWRLCFKDNACGYHSQCVVEHRTAVCGPCTTGATGEPPFCA